MRSFLLSSISLRHWSEESLLHFSIKWLFQIRYLRCFLHFKSAHSISIGLRSGLWQGHSRTLRFLTLTLSLVDLWIYFGSLCWRVQFCFSFNFLTDDFTFSSSIFCYTAEFTMDSMMVSWLGPVAAKLMPNHDTSTSMHHSYEVLFLECCIWFMPKMSSVLGSK